MCKRKKMSARCVPDAQSLPRDACQTHNPYRTIWMVGFSLLKKGLISLNFKYGLDGYSL